MQTLEQIIEQMQKHKQDFLDYNWRAVAWNCSHNRQLANQAYSAMLGQEKRIAAIQSGKPDPMAIHYQ